MANYVTIAEATEQSSFSHQHIAYLLREEKITGRKSGKVWLVDLESLQAYEHEMNLLGSAKHSPKKDD